MKKSINYTLNYREGGETVCVSLSIDFISNYVVREFNAIMQVVYEAKNDWEKFLDRVALRKHLHETKPDEKDKIEFLEKEIVELSDKLKQTGDSNFFQRRFELIKHILIDNGIKQGDKMLTFEFWDECVSADDLVEFLEMVVWKDIEKKN